MKAILIAGATASGKSRLAVELAKRLDGAVINADSMQVYRELRVLTARPSPDDEARVPHHLYGHVSAADSYSVARWLRDLERVLGEVRAAGQRPIVVGGTGMFFTAVTEGLADVPGIPAATRTRIREALKTSGAEALHAELAVKDPAMAARLRATDGQRIARALEVIESTGRSLAVWQGGGTPPLIPLQDADAFLLELDRKDLYARIDTRFVQMIGQGALDEARAFADRRFDPDVPASKALGLRALIEAVEGRSTLDTAVATGQIQSRHYAKRQLTWFRNRFIAWNHIITQDLERMMEEIFSVMALKG